MNKMQLSDNSKVQKLYLFKFNFDLIYIASRGFKSSVFIEFGNLAFNNSIKSLQYNRMLKRSSELGIY